MQTRTVNNGFVSAVNKAVRYNLIARAAEKMQQRTNEMPTLECAKLSQYEMEVYAYACHEDGAE